MSNSHVQYTPLPEKSVKKVSFHRYASWVLLSGMLFRKVYVSQLYSPDTNPSERTCVTSGPRVRFVTWEHISPPTGHMGIHKTYQLYDQVWDVP